GDKTATVLVFKDTRGIQCVDTLTENALVSGYKPERGEVRQPDLLGLMERNGASALLVKDFTTVFSQKDDRVKKFLGELQSIYDGEFVKATGTVGLLAYETRFAIIGCITPIALAKHHKYMSAIGPRFLFYRVPRLTSSERAAGFAVLHASASRQLRLGELGRLVAEQIRKARALIARVEPESEAQRA